jgi:hypothetical protein
MPPVISTIVMLRLFARRQRASMSAYFTNSLTAPTGFGLTGVAPRRVFPTGRAARGPVAPRKMACRPLAGKASQRFKAINSRTGRGSLVAVPFNREQGWTPSRAISLCSPSCRCSAQSLLGRGIGTFLARCFLPSVQSQCSARPIGSGADSRHAKGKSPASGLRRG